MKNLLVLFSFLLVFVANAEEQNATPILNDEEILKQLEKIRQLEGKEYIKNIQEERRPIEIYLRYKKGNCNLPKKDQLLCLAELKALHTTYINYTYTAHKQYLHYLNGKRLKELEQNRMKSLNEIKDYLPKRP